VAEVTIKGSGKVLAARFLTLKDDVSLREVSRNSDVELTRLHRIMTQELDATASEIKSICKALEIDVVEVLQASNDEYHAQLRNEFAKDKHILESIQFFSDTKTQGVKPPKKPTLTNCTEPQQTAVGNKQKGKAATLRAKD
jgi:hypothetical protein